MQAPHRAELGSLSGPPSAVVRWGELGDSRNPWENFYMIYSYYRYFGALAVIKVQHLKQNKSKNLPTTLKRDFERGKQ